MSDPHARVFHAELWGRREDKYQELRDSHVGTTEWAAISMLSDQALFTPQDSALGGEFHDSFPVADALGLYGRPAPGIVTCQDDFAVSFTGAEAVGKVEQLLQTASEAEARSLFRLCSQSQWSYERARAGLADGVWRGLLVPLLYRPLDQRFTILDRNVAVHRRERASSHLAGRLNVALVTTRQTRDAWDCTCTDTVAAHKSCAAYDINYVFPLYLYPDPDAAQQTLLDDSPWSPGPNGRTPNLDPSFVDRWAGLLGLQFVSDGRGDLTETFGPEDLFEWIYAVFHSPGYRARYAEFLKRDFPRIPYTTDRGLFQTLCAHGAALVGLHLLRDIPHSAFLTSFPERGDNVVATGYPKYVETHRRVRINAVQHFDGVPDQVWSFQVGGYQVLDKWLKDRRGRRLSDDDLVHYQQVVVALSRTIDLMAAIDEALEDHGGWPLPGQLADGD